MKKITPLKKASKFSFLCIVIIAVGLFGCGDKEVSVPKSDEKEILSFKINGLDGTITFGDTVDFLFPEGTDISSLTPHIVISDKAKITPASGAAQDFSSEDYLLYTVTAENSTTKKYRVRVKIDVPIYRWGDLYPDPKDPSTAVGVVFWIEEDKLVGTHGKAVSLDEINGIAWSVEEVVTGCNSDDGAENTNIIKSSKNISKYPAFKWCVDKGNGWYLPSYVELSEQLYYCRGNVNLTLREIGAPEVWGGLWINDFYWTSDESALFPIYSALGRGSSGFIHTNKTRTGPILGDSGTPRVRAVIAF